MKKLYTIGHSDRSQEDFIELLHAYNIRCLLDVRTIPKSRHVPWANMDHLKKVLKKENIIYHHLEDLGGLRHTHADSINKAWRNASFRGYADYMQTREFFKGIKILEAWIKEYTYTAIMCAEAVPWRCHRSLIADALLVRHYHITHILQKNSVKEHTLTDFAVVNRNKRPIQIFYPAEPE